MNLHVYTIFPYLALIKTTKFEGIEFKPVFEITGPTTTNNFLKLGGDDQKHLKRILDSFTLPANFTFAVNDVDFERDYKDLKSRLLRAANFIRYFAFSDHRQNIRYYSTFFYVFELSEMEWKEPLKRYEFYRGSLNLEDSVGIAFPRDKILPPHLHQGVTHLSIPGDHFLNLIADEDSWTSGGNTKQDRRRVFRAIEFYNKSFLNFAGVDDRDRVLSLAAAFEALLHLPDSEIGKSFKSSLFNLFGEQEELGEWADGFYNLRSKIIHGEEVALEPRKSSKETKKIPSVFHKHSRGEFEYIDNVDLGQMIFRKAIERILSLRHPSLYFRDILEKLVPNEIHIKNILEGIRGLKNKDDRKEWYESGLFDELTALRANEPTPRVQIDQIEKFGQHLLEMLRVYSVSEKLGLEAKIDQILKFKGNGPDLALAYHELQEGFGRSYFSEKTRITTLEDLVFESSIENFLNFASSIFWVKD